MPEAYLNGLLGGMLIGLAAVVLFWLNGRIMGVSGICSRLLTRPSADSGWRLAFIVGILIGTLFYQSIWGVDIVIDASWGMVIVAGLLVGMGTVLANGCTSGHGICGMARFSKRSIVATLTFIVTGMLVVWVKRWGGM